MDNPNSPSFFRIVNTDYFSFTVFLMPIWIFILLALVTLIEGINAEEWLNFIKPESSNFLYFIMLIAALIICVPLLIWRYRLIALTFEEGTPTPGIVIAVNIFRDRGRIYYTYTQQMQKFEVSNIVHRTQQTRSLQPGQSVTIMVDRNNPRRAFIKEIYF